MKTHYQMVVGLLAVRVHGWQWNGTLLCGTNKTIWRSRSPFHMAIPSTLHMNANATHVFAQKVTVPFFFVFAVAWKMQLGFERLYARRAMPYNIVVGMFNTSIRSFFPRMLSAHPLNLKMAGNILVILTTANWVLFALDISHSKYYFIMLLFR